MDRWKSTEKVRREKIRDGEDQRGRKSEERRCRCAKRYIGKSRKYYYYYSYYYYDYDYDYNSYNLQPQ